MLNRHLLLIVVSLGTVSVAAGELNRREQVDFFERRIRPVLIRRCYQCHSGKSQKLRGGGAVMGSGGVSCRDASSVDRVRARRKRQWACR